MAGERTEINALKVKIEALANCMRDNQCMAEGECPFDKNPIDCYKQLEADRKELEILQSRIKSGGGEAWTGEQSVADTHNTPR